MRQFLYHAWYLLLLATAAVAQTQPIDSQPFYVAPAEAALDKILAPPPAQGSPAYQVDLQTLLDMQRTRSDAQVKDAQADAEISVFRFADVLGAEFRADRLPVTTKFLRQVNTDAGRAVGLAKDRFHRARPYVASTDVQPVLSRPESDSYPSGHATFGYTTGILLAMMVPEQAPELFERAARYGRNRNIGGVHYPTDVEAGRISATVIIALALRSPKFAADFAEARKELRAALARK